MVVKILFTLVTVCSLAVYHSCSGERHEVSLDEKFVFGWEIDTDSILLDATVNTIGYVGIGISEKGKMDGADMAMGGVKDGGKIYHGIYHGKHHKPILDRKQNWKLVEASQNSTHTFVKYSRLLNTGDPQNVQITDKDTYIIWAIGKSDKLKKHHGHGKYRVNLIHPSEKKQDQPDTVTKFVLSATNVFHSSASSLLSLFSTFYQTV